MFRTQLNLVHAFTLLNPGTIKEVFKPVRQVGTPKVTRSKMDLPQVSGQCAHVGYEEVSEGYEVVRCTNDAVLAQNGWLCAQHHGWIDMTVRTTRTPRPAIEPVQAIIELERKAIAQGQRHSVRLTCKGATLHTLELLTAF